MTASTAPTQPDKCPACGAAVTKTWKSESGQSDFVELGCGLQLANQSGNPGWKVYHGKACPKWFDAAIALRALLDESERISRDIHADNEKLRAERDAALAQVESWRKRIEAHMDYIEPKIDRTQENVEKLVVEKDALAARVGELQAAANTCISYAQTLLTFTGYNATHAEERELFTNNIIKDLRAALSPARESDVRK